MKNKSNLSDKKNVRRRRLALFLCVVLLIGILPVNSGGTGQSVGTITAEAEGEEQPQAPKFYFKAGGGPGDSSDQIIPMGGTYELKNDQIKMTLYKEGGVGIATGTSIRLDPNSLDQNKSNVAFATEPLAENPYSFGIIRKGPGYEQISGYIREAGGLDYPFNFWIKVPVDIESTNGLDLWESDKKGYGYYGYDSTDLPENFSLKLQYPTLQFQLQLANLVPKPVPSGIECKYDYSKYELAWAVETEKMENTEVVTVDNNGVVTSVGAGMAKVKVQTVTQDKDRIVSDDVRIINPLLFSTEPPKETTASGYQGVLARYADFSRKDAKKQTKVDGMAVFYSTINDPSRLEWKVTDKNGKDVSKWFDISFETMKQTGLNASRITIVGAKAGTYTLNAQIKKLPAEKPEFNGQVTMEIPVDYSPRDIWMNVHDRYNMLDNTNIPPSMKFTFVSSDPNVAEVNSTNGIITALKKGQTTVTATSEDGNTLICNVHVVDTLSLNTGKATIPVGGTLDLFAQTTDIGRNITWTVEDSTIVSIEEDGGAEALITGLKAGMTTVTASQTINGVEKTASCLIEVVPEISKIEVTPPQVEIDIEEYAVLKAKVTPALATGAKLHWVSSDPSIVALEDPNNRSTTCSVYGVAPGTAVVMAINQSNVVVGSSVVTVLRAPDSITLSEHEVKAPVSAGQYQLHATILPTTATNKKVNWKSSNPKIATVDENGLVKFVKHGTVTIIATADGKPELTDMCELTITEGVSGIVLDDKTLTMNVGEQKRLTYEVLPKTAYDRSVTFTSMDTKVAVVDSTGLITAKKAGTTYITVRTTDGDFSQVCTVTVKQSATTINLDATALVLDAGESYNLEVSFNPKTTTETKLRWSSNDTSVAKVDGKGRVTGVGAGDCVITVVTSNNLVAFCYVTVNEAVTGVELNYEEVKVAKGKFVELEATVLPSNASNQEVTWKSSNEKIAQVSDSGTVKGISGGSAIITCTTDEGGFAAVCMVTVIEKVVSIKLNKSSYKLGLGKKFTLEAKVSNSSASDQSVKWVSSDPKICSVNEKGVITGKKLGYATITAYAKDGSEAEASCEVRVVRQATGLTLDKNLLNMVVGDSSKLKATIRPKDATYKKAKFSSDNTEVALVDSDGKVTAVGPGTCKITAQAKDSSGLKSVCVVIVKPVVPATGITLSPNEVTLGIGGTENVLYSLKPNDSTDHVTWSSNNKAVATVGKTSGTIKAKAPGTAVVTATTSSGKSASVKVTVVGLNYSSLTLEQYDTYTLRVMGVTSGIIWDVDNPDICKVVGGRVTAKKAGTTYVVARVNGAELRCRVKVTDIK